ncbi:hypothetical protein [Jeotgalibacillus proteolyticus]|uniref:hypothetical protein n=1 Tax=Jeotgalibacillus proteolyticus TaxID=2082395 RepID=UPI003CF57DEB
MTKNRLAVTGMLLLAIALAYSSFEVSMKYLQSKEDSYIPQEPYREETISEEDLQRQEPSRMISHLAPSTEEQKLPVKTENHYIVYENSLFVTINNGDTWVRVPDDETAGYAKISDYLDGVSAQSVYQRDERITVVYGGRGVENLSLITTRDSGEVWSVGSVPRTATGALDKGYDELFIDFLEDGTGYLAAVPEDDETVLAFRSVNNGVTWDPVENRDELYTEILRHFELSGGV